MIRLFQPSVGPDELAAVRRAFERAWLGLGGEVAAFENEFAAYLGVAAALGVNSGTAALHLALAGFGFPAGGRVLVNNLTFVASATCILANGLTPVLVDCDEVTLGFDLEDAARKVDATTVAMVVVHYAGHPAPMDEIMAFARAHGLRVIEDCAHSLGMRYGGRHLGTWGDVGCFSFEEKKAMTTGDGGMLVAGDADFVERLKPHRWVGIDKDTWRRRDSYTAAGETDTRHWHYEVAVLGHKYNMNDLAAAIGRVQLRRLDQFIDRRQQLIARYLDRLSGIEGVTPLLPYIPGEGGYWLFGIRTPARDALIRDLKRHAIATGVHYMPLGLHPLFAPFNMHVPVSSRVWHELLTLPFHAELTDDEVDRVCAAVAESSARLVGSTS